MSFVLSVQPTFHQVCFRSLHSRREIHNTGFHKCTPGSYMNTGVVGEAVAGRFRSRLPAPRRSSIANCLAAAALRPGPDG